MKPLIREIDNNPLLRTIFDSVACGIVVVDKERKVIALNDVLKQALGIPSGSAVGKRVGEVLGCIHVKDRELLQECCDKTGCEECEIRRAALNAISNNRRCRTRAVVSVVVNEKTYDISLLLNAIPFDFEAERYAVVLIENVGKLRSLKQQYGRCVGIESIVGEHKSIRELKETIKEVAQYDFPVLIQGESGTGKELVAMAIHAESRRANRFFVPVNCAALPHGLLESELFGHLKGAFTGALKDKKGRFELANGGTLFLDEIGDLDLNLQVKLLRVLQEGSFEKVGSTETTHVDVRIISATNKDLQSEVEKKTFRLDLFYRLCVAPIYIPPLRERTSDIPLLTEHFIKLFMDERSGSPPTVSKGVIDTLVRHTWQGNVRELQNVVQYSLMKSRGRKIRPEHLPPYVTQLTPKTVRRKRKITEEMVQEALKKTGGNKMKAAKLLGVSRSTLYRFIDEVMNT